MSYETEIRSIYEATRDPNLIKPGQPKGYQQALIMLAQVEIRLREMPLQDGSSLWDQVEDILQTKLQRLQERLEEDA